MSFDSDKNLMRAKYKEKNLMESPLWSTRPTVPHLLYKEKKILRKTVGVARFGIVKMSF